MKELFEKYEDEEFLRFDRVENKRSLRSDLHAFLLLDQIYTTDRDIVACAEHDQIYLAFDEDVLESKASDDQILELVRCGVMLEEDGSLSMFV